MPIIESIPNVSEGRRTEIVERLADAIRGTPGVRLLDYSSDPSHNRSVFTLAGDAGPIKAATMALFEQAVATIDLRNHQGEHPRLGAVDVVPFVPIEGVDQHEAGKVHLFPFPLVFSDLSSQGLEPHVKERRRP